MKRNSALLLILCVNTLVCGGAAQAADKHFVEIPGKLRFSGRLVVRPVQPAEWAARGVVAADAAAHAKAATALLAPQLIRLVIATDEYIVRVPPNETENTFSLRLMKSGVFQYAEPDWLCTFVSTPNDPLFVQQWQHTPLQSTQAWDTTIGDPNAIVAICDSGVSPTHPDLQLVAGRNVVSGNDDTTDINGHGTFCAGMAAATGNNGIGVVGAGWSLRVMPVRVTNDVSGDAFLTDITAGTRWAADHGARAINASYTGVESGSVQTAGNYCRQRNALLFWAAGNDNQQIPGGDHPDVIVVGATNVGDGRASFSNWGDLIDVVAPGANVMSTRWSPGGGNEYGSGSGTSFSTPLTAGVAAMIWSVNPSLSAGDVEGILFASCDDLGASGDDQVFGRGRVNLSRAVLGANPSGTWVNFAYTGPEDGSFTRPFNTFAEGIAAVPTEGILRFFPGSSPETGTVSRAMTLTAPLGPVTIGQ